MKKAKKYEPSFEERRADNKLRNSSNVSIDEIEEIMHEGDESKITKLFESVQKYGSERWWILKRGKCYIQDKKMVMKIYKNVTGDSWKPYIDTGYSDVDLQ